MFLSIRKGGSVSVFLSISCTELQPVVILAVFFGDTFKHGFSIILIDFASSFNPITFMFASYLSGSPTESNRIILSGILQQLHTFPKVVSISELNHSKHVTQTFLRTHFSCMKLLWQISANAFLDILKGSSKMYYWLHHRQGSIFQTSVPIYSIPETSDIHFIIIRSFSGVFLVLLSFQKFLQVILSMSNTLLTVTNYCRYVCWHY